MIEKVTKSVYLVGSGELSGPGDCMVYAVILRDETLCLIDAGTTNSMAILRNMGDLPVKKVEIAHLILTHAHFDHAGAAHQFKKKFPTMIIHAHEQDVPAIQGRPGTDGITAASWYGATYRPVRVDDALEGTSGKLILGGSELMFHHTPGHTPGSISITIEDEGFKILFGQDIHGPFMEEFNSSVDDWARSMKHLLELQADILCEGHFGIYHGKEKVRNFIHSYLHQHGY
ncbi:MAG: MBL fold metallo-hydrolase [Promethearchaeota archaeon]